MRSPKEGIPAREEVLKKEEEITEAWKAYEEILKEAQEAAEKKIYDVMETEYGVSALHLGKAPFEWALHPAWVTG